MSMQMRVQHTTTYTYEDESSALYSEARLTPLTTSEQFVRRSRVEVSPTAWSYEYRDYWGTAVTSFEVTEPHSTLVVKATSVVDTADANEPVVSVDWDALGDPDTVDEHCEFLAMTDLVEPDPALASHVKALKQQSVRPVDLVESVCELIRTSMRQLVAATHVSSTAAEAWQAGEGVSHDFAHVAIGALRSAGVPTRFVSGYIHPMPDPEIGSAVDSEAHAWIEWWDGAWVGWDVAFAHVPGERHIVVSVGRDFADNPPLRGIYASEGPVRTDVSVRITRLA